MDEWGSDEQELVRRCKEGSEAAYAVLVRLHRPRLYKLAYRLLLDRESAEDVVQETFIAAFRQMERFEPRPSLSAWLNTIVLRTAGRAAARRRARPNTSIDASAFRDDGHDATAGSEWPGDHLALADADPTADPHAAAEAAALREEIAAAIAGLPFKYRAAVVVRHVMGLDYEEAARTLGVPLNTFKSNLLRGTKMLRESLAVRARPGSRDRWRPLLRRAAGPSAKPVWRPANGPPSERRSNSRHPSNRRLSASPAARHARGEGQTLAPPVPGGPAPATFPALPAMYRV